MSNENQRPASIHTDTSLAGEVIMSQPGVRPDPPPSPFSDDGFLPLAHTPDHLVPRLQSVVESLEHNSRHRWTELVQRLTATERGQANTITLINRLDEQLSAETERAATAFDLQQLESSCNILNHHIENSNTRLRERVMQLEKDLRETREIVGVSMRDFGQHDPFCRVQFVMDAVFPGLEDVLRQITNWFDPAPEQLDARTWKRRCEDAITDKLIRPGMYQDKLKVIQDYRRQRLTPPWSAFCFLVIKQSRPDRHNGPVIVQPDDLQLREISDQIFGPRFQPNALFGDGPSVGGKLYFWNGRDPVEHIESLAQIRENHTRFAYHAFYERFAGKPSE